MDIQQIYETNQKLKKSDVKDLENWMESQPHLPKTDGKIIIHILNACEFNVESAKRCIEFYYTIRASFTALFSERDPELPNNIKGLDVSFFEPFPQLSPEGHGIFYYKLIDTSVDNFEFCTIVKLMDMRLHSWLREVGFAEGIQVVVDMEGSTWRHWKKIGFMNARKVLSYLVEGFPVRLIAIHFVNPMYFLNAVLTILYPFMSNELQQSIKIHKNYTFLDVLPKYCIPDELYGTGGSVQKLHQNYIETIRKNRDYFIDDEQFKADESKRIVTGGFLKRFGF